VKSMDVQTTVRQLSRHTCREVRVHTSAAVPKSYRRGAELLFEALCAELSHEAGRFRYRNDETLSLSTIYRDGFILEQRVGY
jgi:hypothetical protein